MKSKNVQKKYDKQLFAISSYFKELRYAENLTQAEVGIEAGLNRNTILNIENIKNFKILTLFQLCEFYRVSASELLSIIDEL